MIYGTSKSGLESIIMIGFYKLLQLECIHWKLVGKFYHERFFYWQILKEYRKLVTYVESYDESRNSNLPHHVRTVEKSFSTSQE